MIFCRGETFEFYTRNQTGQFYMINVLGNQYKLYAIYKIQIKVSDDIHQVTFGC